MTRVWRWLAELRKPTWFLLGWILGSTFSRWWIEHELERADPFVLEVTGVVALVLAGLWMALWVLLRVWSRP